jgi:membrane fusion protein, macrolide-specific efflux system
VTTAEDTVTTQEGTVTTDEDAVTSAEDTEKTTEDKDEATVTADSEAVTSAEDSYNTQLAENTNSATPVEATVAADQATVTTDNVTVQEDQLALNGTKLYAPFGATIASISSDVGDMVSSASSAVSSSSSTGSSSSSTGSSGSGSSSSGSSSSSSSGEAAATGGNHSGTGAGGAGSSSTPSGFIVLSDLSNLLAQATFDQTDAASLRNGAAATVTPQGVTTAKALSAVVEEVDPTSTTSNGVVDYGVTLALTNRPTGLKSGESVSVSVITGEVNNALYVPSTAVTTSGTESTVVVVGPNNKEQTVPVALGVQGSTDDQILSGVSLGEKVLTSTATPISSTGGFPGRGGLGGGGLGGGGGGGGGVRIGGGAP